MNQRNAHFLNQYFNFKCLIHVSKPVVYLQEGCCICSYGTVRFACIGISIIGGGRVCSEKYKN